MEFGRELFFDFCGLRRDLGFWDFGWGWGERGSRRPSVLTAMERADTIICTANPFTTTGSS